jgi:hypothetical protein
MTIVLDTLFYLAACCVSATALTFALDWLFKKALCEFEGFFQ